MANETEKEDNQTHENQKYTQKRTIQRQTESNPNTSKLALVETMTQNRISLKKPGHLCPPLYN